MTARIKIGANEQCPCWSGQKYKRCCKSKIDWPAILASGNQRKYLSIRGRNILFMTAVWDALGFDPDDDLPALPQYKKAFTAQAVRKIYEAVFDIWPPDTAIQSLLERTGASVSGLYIGDYAPAYVERALVRHSVYANKILLVDPFIHPFVMADKYNPILNPQSFRAQTLKNVNLYRKMLPWIDAGIVEFIRTPADFDRGLNYRALQNAHHLVENTPELKAAVATGVEELKRRHWERTSREYALLSLPDAQIRRIIQKSGLLPDGSTADDILAHVNSLRERDPDFLEPASREGQMHMTFAGGTHEMARLSAQLAGAYLFTDLRPRWAMIEHDRKQHTAENKVWSPFAKAVQNTKLHYLNNIEISHALRLRKDGRLEGVRSLLTNVWAKTRSDDAFSEENAIRFAEELNRRVDEAEAEWIGIKKEFSKYVGAGLAGGVLSLNAAIYTGHANWLAGAAIVAGATTAVWHGYQRSAYPKRYPAAFFMDLRENDSE